MRNNECDIWVSFHSPGHKQVDDGPGFIKEELKNSCRVLGHRNSRLNVTFVCSTWVGRMNENRCTSAVEFSENRVEERVAKVDA